MSYLGDLHSNDVGLRRQVLWDVTIVRIGSFRKGCSVIRSIERPFSSTRAGGRFQKVNVVNVTHFLKEDRKRENAWLMCFNDLVLIESSPARFFRRNKKV